MLTTNPFPREVLIVNSGISRPNVQWYEGVSLGECEEGIEAATVVEVGTILGAAALK